MYALDWKQDLEQSGRQLQIHKDAKTMYHKIFLTGSMRVREATLNAMLQLWDEEKQYRQQCVDQENDKGKGKGKEKEEEKEKEIS